MKNAYRTAKGPKDSRWEWEIKWNYLEAGEKKNEKHKRIHDQR